MKVFVIGATGYIGSVCAERLLESGHQVTGMARTPEGSSKLRKLGIEPRECSFNDDGKLIAAVEEADVVLYAAYGYNDAEDAKKELVSGRSHITDVLRAMAGTDKTFVLTSGSGVFWDSEDIVYEETTPLPKTSDPVVLARRALEDEVITAASQGVRSIVLRPPTVYGRGGSLLIPRFLLDYALKTGQSVCIKGSENNKWSVVHIDDLVDLFMLAIEKAPAGSLYNTGSESGITAAQIAESISRVTGLGGKITLISLADARKIWGHWGDWWSINNQLSGEKAKAELGWKPSRPSMLVDIEQGSYATQPAKR